MPVMKPLVSKWQDAIAVAEIYGVTPATVYRMAKDGEIPFLKVRGQYRFQLEQVDRALREQTKTKEVTA